MTAFRDKPPTYFWIVSALIVLWGVMGVVAFYMDVAMTPAQIAALPDYDRKLLASRPTWFVWLYGAAVISGLIGGILLLLRSARARPVFVLSLVLVIVMFGYIFAATDLIAVKGFFAAAGFPILIAAIGVFQIVFAKKAQGHGCIG